MTSHRIHTSGNDQWNNPRPVICQARQRHIYGRPRPMEEPGIIERLLRKFRRK